MRKCSNNCGGAGLTLQQPPEARSLRVVCSSTAPARVHLPRDTPSASGLPAWTRSTGSARLSSGLLSSLPRVFFFFFLISKEKLLVLLGDLMHGGVISKTAVYPLILEDLLLGSFNLWVELHPNFNIRGMGGSQTCSHGGVSGSQHFCGTHTHTKVVCATSNHPSLC